MKIAKNMQNPYDLTRKAMTKALSDESMNQKLYGKFQQKSYRQRFKYIYHTSYWLKYAIQAVSMVTGFIALSYLLASWHPVLSTLVSIVLVVTIEIIKRASTEDVMHRAVQGMTVSRFAVVCGLAAIAASIYISLQGAVLAPNLVVADASAPVVVEQSSKAIEDEYGQRVAKLEQERETYRRERTWKGKLSSEDAQYIKAIDNRIAKTLDKKDATLLALQESNKALHATAQAEYQQAVATVDNKRETLGTQLYWAQLIAELLYLVFSIIEWVYSWEVVKENPDVIKEPVASTPSKGKGPSGYASRPPVSAAAPLVSSQLGNNGTAAAPQMSADVPQRTADDQPPARNKIGFVQDGSQPTPQVEIVEQVELVKKEFTRTCAHCNQGYIHNASNQKYCGTPCKKAAARNRKA